jgi:Site-specific DNA methylase
MTEFFKDFINNNGMKNVTYAEPYSGGAGAAINLLINENVEKILINDASIAVYSFWYSLVHHGELFLQKFDNTDVNLSEWKIQREIFRNKVKPNCIEDYISLGFATFFLNRCNRSGILHAGPIGGQTEEKQAAANFKIDARYNKEKLRERLVSVIERRKQITVSNDDALVFLKKRIKSKPASIQSNILVYLDPPYFIQGANLYLNYYIPSDHVKLANYLKKNSHFKWILSYDDENDIRNLYKQFKQYSFNLSYSLNQNKKGNELLIHSNNSKLSSPANIKRTKNKYIPLTEVFR